MMDEGEVRSMHEPLPIEIDCKTVRAMLDAGEDFLLVDCREPDEHQAVSLVEAKLIPMGEIDSRLGEIEPWRDREIVVHCHHGIRSQKVVRWLRQQGFSRARSLAGGIDQWAVEIDPALRRY